MGEPQMQATLLQHRIGNDRLRAMRFYAYVGPSGIRAKSLGKPTGREIASAIDISKWTRETQQAARRGEPIVATYVVDSSGQLLIADRHSEHIACAGGCDVLAAGEITFVVEGSTDVHVTEVSNQSTGYCPEPDCWEVVAHALEQIGVAHPPELTMQCIFRKCVACGTTNIVKDGWFYCDVCGNGLPNKWNFD